MSGCRPNANVLCGSPASIRTQTVFKSKIGTEYCFSEKLLPTFMRLLVFERARKGRIDRQADRMNF